MKDPQLSGIAKALAAHGRKGDTELVHVSKKELETLQQYGDQLGIHLTKNPATGLPEAFNWGGMIGSVGLPLLLTIASGGTLGPLALAAAGAAGGAGGTLMGGGSTDQALMSGVMGGIGGFGMGGIGEGLAAAGTAATEQAATQAVEQSAAQAATQATTDAAVQGAGQSTLQTLAQQGASQTSPLLQNLAQQGGENLIAEGASRAAGSVVNGAFVPNAATPVLQSTPMTGTQLMGKGWEAVSSNPQALGNFAMDQAKNIGMAGIGAIGAGTSLNPQETTIQTEPDTSNPYSAEWYVDPATGQRRTRAVRRANGGEIYGGYDGVEEAADGGYIPGGGLNFAGGGGIGDLGFYSDGGRMLRGAGDGVSDSIPATIEGKRPARLADGEFVIPSRIVSELGNGSTEAGARALYKMMDRVQARRRKTVGKDGIAKDSKARNELPA